MKTLRISVNLQDQLFVFNLIVKTQKDQNIRLMVSNCVKKFTLVLTEISFKLCLGDMILRTLLYT